MNLPVQNEQMDIVKEINISLDQTNVL